MGTHTRGHARQRIVSLAPSVTSILLALGVRRELVGVSKWCKEVAEIGARPQVGDCWKLDIADVMRLRPTLLIGSVPFAAETVARILDQPVSFLALNPRTLADIENNIRLLGGLLHRDARAEKLLRTMRHGFNKVAVHAAGIQKVPKPRVYCEAWPNPRISSPPWVAELVSIAGGESVLPSGARVSDKEVARANPDVIVLAWAATGSHGNPGRTLRNAAWAHVSAVKSGRVVVIADHLLNTPGPPLVPGVQELFRAIHPGTQLENRSMKRDR